MPIIELGIPEFRKASSGLRLLDIAVHKRTLDIYKTEKLSEIDSNIRHWQQGATAHYQKYYNHKDIHRMPIKIQHLIAI